jgi:hypothetical protein
MMLRLRQWEIFGIFSIMVVSMAIAATVLEDVQGKHFLKERRILLPLLNENGQHIPASTLVVLSMYIIKDQRGFKKKKQSTVTNDAFAVVYSMDFTNT